MADSGISMPSGYGGLMRYNEDYDSYITFKPIYIMLFVVLIIGLRIVLPLIFKI